MPIPKPHKGESQPDFMDRCMHSEAIKEFEKHEQQVGVCLSQWRRGTEDSMKTWYEIRNAQSPEADIYLYDEIGGWGVTADQFVKDLAGVKSKAINLFVNSPGGDAFGGMAIYNALQRHPANVKATVDGIAASSASFIVQAADQITMSQGSTMMIHEPYGMTLGNAADMEKTRDMLSKMGDNIASIYAARAGGTEAEWRARMRDESWYRAQEAVDIGLADMVAPGKQVAAMAVFNLAKFGYQHIPVWLEVKDESGTGDPEFDLSVLKESAVLAPPAPSMESLLQKYPLKEALKAGTASGGGS